MTRFVSCPAHVRSTDLGAVAMLVDLRTGRVDTLLDWTRDAWMALARTGDGSSVPAAVGVPAERVDELVRQLRADGFLTNSGTSRPWSVPTVPPTAPSWGTTGFRGHGDRVQADVGHELLTSDRFRSRGWHVANGG
ncbi:MAG: hypothetical protein ACRDQ7_17315 [Haloechinothrix sp.]